MSHLCIISDSHAAALKLAWDEMAQAHQHKVKISFFAGRKDQTKDLLPVEGRLVPKNKQLADQIELTSNGHRFIDPTHFNAFLIYRFWKRSWENVNAFSAEFKRRSILDRAHQGLLYQHLVNVRHITDKPIFVALSPLPAEKAGMGIPSLLEHREEISLVQTHICEEYSAKVVPQPMNTLNNDSATKPIFAQNSQRLEIVGQEKSESHPEEEPYHMNKAYGRVWLESFLPLLEQI